MGAFLRSAGLLLLVLTGTCCADIAEPQCPAASGTFSGLFLTIQGIDVFGRRFTNVDESIGCTDVVIPFSIGADSSFRSDIYGPFLEEPLLFTCPNSSVVSVPAGLDTQLARRSINFQCNTTGLTFLDSCGGYMPSNTSSYRYHEGMSCHYGADPLTNHSTRIGFLNSNQPLYGPFITGGVLPTDLDACGGRTGITPDSATPIYYYPLKLEPPFTLGCYGASDDPLPTVADCRAEYTDNCVADDLVSVETAEGNIVYDPFCPCFDEAGHNTEQPTPPAAPTPFPTPAPTTDDSSTTLESVLGVLAPVGLMVCVVCFCVLTPNLPDPERACNRACNRACDSCCDVLLCQCCCRTLCPDAPKQQRSWTLRV